MTRRGGDDGTRKLELLTAAQTPRPLGCETLWGGREGGERGKGDEGRGILPSRARRRERATRAADAFTGRQASDREKCDVSDGERAGSVTANLTAV